jgi:23S rRNA (uracil1939-C5)-methyltransferase
MTLEIEKMVYGGDGLARNEGQVVLLPFVLPGERVQAGPTQHSGGVTRALAESILESSAERTSPACRYFGRCGGCQYQHAIYEAQLDWKRSILVETLARVGKIAAPEDIRVLSGEPWGYRNRVQLHLDGERIGYQEARSRSLCALDQCPISSPRLNQALQMLTEMVRDRRWPGFIESLELFTNESEIQINVRSSRRPVAKRFFEWCGEKIAGVVPGALDYRVGDLAFRVSGQSFFQVNRHLVGTLVDCALGDASGEHALDLYAGVGMFSLPLARRFRQVVAAESGSSAARDLTFNAERAKLPVSVRQSSTETFLADAHVRPDFVLADPPRAGLGKRTVMRLLELKPPALTIVACDPATLARDLAALVSGGYRIEDLTLIDLFPQTFHIETIVRCRI